MKVVRVLVALSFLLLGGCLATFKESIPLGERAPAQLLGTWTGLDSWGDQYFVKIAGRADGGYQARVWREARGDTPAEARDIEFNVTRHGRRWYLSASAPAELGGHFAFGGFELSGDDALALYSLDLETVGLALEEGRLRGRVTGSAGGEGVLIESPLAEVLAFLDDQANSDVFVEVARFRRVSLQQE
ncbi:hypothetical protein NGA35_04230 [Pseudomonas stutzeri]|nr:hypothetical protein [Stutzerimonas stutzeri]